MKIHKICLLGLATVILIGPMSFATCTNANVTGVWGYFVGTATGQFTADGNGNITNGSQTVSQNGTILTQTFTGTYSVARNCTGTIMVNITGGGTGTASFVLDNLNKGFQLIDTISGMVAEGFGMSQGTVTCGLTGKKAIFAAELLGKDIIAGPIAYVAQVSLGGTGRVSGSGTFDTNGTIVSGSLSGTYTESSNCTGTMQITPSGWSTLNFNFVVVNSGKEILLIETDPNTAVAGYIQQ